MAHELEHAESAVYAGNQPAWHRLGIVRPEHALTREQVIDLVPELGSTITPSPVLAVNGNDVVMAPEIPGRGVRWIANVRDYDAKMVGVVGPGYQLVQPAQVWDFVEELIQSSDGAIVDTGLSLRHGSVMVVCVKLPSHVLIGGMADEAHDVYLMIVNSYDGSIAFTTTISLVRTVCMNTVQWAMASAARTFKLRHTESIEGRLMDARKALDMTYAYGDKLDEMARQLLDVKIGEADVPTLLEGIFPARPLQQGEEQLPTLYIERLNEKRSDVQKHYATADNLNNVRGTGWGLLNAITEWEQYLAHPKRNPEAAMESILEDSTLATRAVQRILAHA